MLKKCVLLVVALVMIFSFPACAKSPKPIPAPAPSPEKLKPAEFKVGNLKISPTEVEPGQSVNISIEVKNIGEKEGTHKVKLRIDGKAEATKEITLKGGGSKRVSFTVKRESAKAYNVEVAGLSETFTITKPKVKPTPTPTPEKEKPTPTPTLKPGPPSAIETANFEAIDEHALNAPKAAEESIASLAKYLAKPAKNDLEKVRAIYRWITDNISYDVEGYFTEDYGDQSPRSVLVSRSAVCEGYSGLFQSLAEAVGLEAVTIGGWAKGYFRELGESTKDSPNHAWNAVKIGGGWYLLDCTWGAGCVTSEGNYIKRFEEFFFLTPPQEFVYSHLPEEPKWQLLENPVSKHKFAEFPHMWLGFFKYNLELGTPKKGVLEVEDDITVTVKAPKNVVLSAGLKRGGKDLAEYFTSTKRVGDRYEVSAVFPEAGEYVLIIFAGKKSGESLYSALDYRVNVSEGRPGFKGFPKKRPAFSKYDLELVSPNKYLLDVKDEVAITIKAPKDVMVWAILLQDDTELSKHLTFSQRRGDTYQTRAVFPKSGDYILRIVAGEKEAEVFYTALEYKVEVSKGVSGPAGFPKTYTSFHERGAYLYSPMEGYLEAGTTQNFKIKVPGAEEVAVIMDDQWHHLSRSGEIFQGEVKVRGDEVKVVFAKSSGAERFWSLLTYECE